MLYRFVVWLCKIFFSIFFRVTYQGIENIPTQGPLLVCCNHISLLDMFLFAPQVPRRVYFMAKKELFNIPILNIILKELGAFPVKRGRGDLSAAKTTLHLLSEGKAVGIFPEGTRRKKNKGRIKPKSGVALFAFESGAPIIPVGIFGNYRIFSKLKVVYGNPYIPDWENDEKVTKQDMRDMVNKLMQIIYSLEID